ncbi:augmin complex subunit dgt3 [Sitodiplosis mosellana]|uniref:augmin complex subunit dgt3 n=1 Tax=Sitodiplosis mosellana TaxID=263140 RepID=UPI0024445818|nr:augmin complex subunit dgt3 [Sitodiplosis mosellana]
MTMVDPATNLAFLRKCGIPEWVLVDEDWKDFVGFFKENISDTNILTDEELVELARLKQDENVKTTTLAKRMDKIAKEYNGIWSVNEDDIVEVEKRIEIATQEEEFYDDLIAKAKSATLDTIEEITVLKGRTTRIISEEPILADECLKQMEELQEVKLSNERKISELGQLYLKPAQNPLFMHQMPLNDYFRQLEQFNTSSKHFMQKNFKVQSAEEEISDDKDIDDKARVLTELSVLADRLLNAYNKLYLAEMNFNAKTALTNQLKAQNWSPSTVGGMRREMSEMERDIELNESQKQHLVHKLQEQAAELAQLDVEALVFDSNQKRMGRAKQRMEFITRFADIISETMALSELFWVLMQLDMERMKNRNNYDSKLDAYRLESLSCNRRIELMNMIGKLSDTTSVQTVCNGFMELLEVNPNVYDASTVEQAIKCIITVDEFKSSITKLIQNTENNITTLWRNNDFFKKAIRIVELIRKFLYDGPIAKPQQYSTWYRMKKSFLERELQAINEITEKKRDECSHYIKKWSNDKYWRHKQVLWVWFLTEPKKVIKSLKSISAEAQQRSKAATTAPRHIAGIVRKI